VQIGAFVVDEVDVLFVVVDHPEYIAEVFVVAREEAEFEGEGKTIPWTPWCNGKEVEGGTAVLYFGMTVKAEAVGLRGGGAGDQ
jgi:hypothetical protein